MNFQFHLLPMLFNEQNLELKFGLLSELTGIETQIIPILGSSILVYMQTAYCWFGCSTPVKLRETQCATQETTICCSLRLTYLTISLIICVYQRQWRSCTAGDVMMWRQICSCQHVVLLGAGFLSGCQRAGGHRRDGKATVSLRGSAPNVTLFPI